MQTQNNVHQEDAQLTSHQQKTTWKLVGLLSMLMLVVGLAEWWSPVSLRLLFVPMILIAAWRGDRTMGFGFAISAAMISVLPTLQTDVTSLTVFPLLMEFLTRTVLFGGLALMCTELRTSREHGRRIARTDFLTGALNAKGFRELLHAEQNRHERIEQPLTVAYLDADHFKKLNDTQGHRAGDRLLISVVQTLQQHVRNYDSVARLGGDEFAILLINTHAKSAKMILTRIQGALSQMAASLNLPVTFSIGVVTFPTFPEESGEMLELADREMYAVKNTERGTIKFSTYGETNPPPQTLTIHKEED